VEGALTKLTQSAELDHILFVNGLYGWKNVCDLFYYVVVFPIVYCQRIEQCVAALNLETCVFDTQNPMNRLSRLASRQYVLAFRVGSVSGTYVDGPPDSST
jgi:hypothetical protein